MPTSTCIWTRPPTIVAHAPPGTTRDPVTRSASHACAATVQRCSIPKALAHSRSSRSVHPATELAGSAMLGSAIRRRKRISYSIQSGGWSRGRFASRVGPAMRILPKAAAIVGLPLTTFLGTGSTHSLADFPVSPPQPDQRTAKPTKPSPPPDKTKMRTAGGSGSCPGREPEGGVRRGERGRGALMLPLLRRGSDDAGPVPAVFYPPLSSRGRGGRTTN